MTFQNTSLVYVYFMGKTNKCLMGRLLLKNRKIFFEYEPEFIKMEINLSPFKLALKPGIIESQDRIFEGLFGLFNDSLPDGWGRLLLDRKLMSLGFNPRNLSPLDRLCFVGNTGMGALAYEPEHPRQASLTHENLDEIYNEIVCFQEKDDDHFVDDLLNLSGSSAGARPKITLQIGGEDWIIKFRSSLDLKDIGNIEYAYHLMAKEAQLELPQAKLFPSKKDRAYFGVKRFDRVPAKRIHMHTMSGLLHIDHREPSLDYETIMRTTLWLTRNIALCEKQFRAAVFNVLSHNRDDHAKNFSFLMDQEGNWSISPSYDLTFSTGPSGEHCTTLMGEGKEPNLNHLLQLANIANLEKQKALDIINEVASAVSKWPLFAKEADVSTSSQRMIQIALDRIKQYMARP